MVGLMTFGKKKYENLDSKMRKLIPPIYQVMIDLVPFVDADTNAFNMYMVRIYKYIYVIYRLGGPYWKNIFRYGPT